MSSEDIRFLTEVSKFLYLKNKTNRSKIEITCENITEERYRAFMDNIITPCFGENIITNVEGRQEYTIQTAPFTSIISQRVGETYTIRAIMTYFEEISQDHVLATLMGQHMRLGESSIIHTLSPEIIRDGILPSIAHMNPVSYTSSDEKIMGNLLVMRKEKMKIEPFFPMNVHADNNAEYIFLFSLFNIRIVEKFIRNMNNLFNPVKQNLRGKEVNVIVFARGEERKRFLVAIDRERFEVGIKGFFIRQEGLPTKNIIKHPNSSIYFLTLLYKYLKRFGYVNNNNRETV